MANRVLFNRYIKTLKQSESNKIYWIGK